MKNYQINFFVFFLFFILTKVVYCQEKLIRISGKISSDENEPLPNCNILIQGKINPKLIAYTTTGNGNEFQVLLHWDQADTAVIIISHVGFRSKRIETAVHPGTTIQFDIKLTPDPKMLEDVTFISPIMKHGDTTSYNVKSFTEPTDIKLIDVINYLPGFTADEKGIYFKGKKVARITLDNHELFADKINLLTSNLPVDGLKTIQALENQNMNEKLKGLTGDDEVFVNLITKKNSIFFGDVEAGAGTLGRYKLNPVVFQLRNKIKAGLIANWNNSGKTQSAGDDFQLRGEDYENATGKSIRGTGIYIPNFNQSRYVKNHLGDVRFSLNRNISKSIKNNAEISFIKDNRLQSSFENSQILNGDSLIQKFAVNNVNTLPFYFQIADKILYDINKNSALNAKIIFASDRGKYKAVNEIEQERLTYSTSSEIKNNWNTFSANLDYTNRLTEKKALDIQTSLGFYNLPQMAYSFSPDWFELFLLPDSSYRQLYQPYSNRILSFKTTVNYMVRKGKRLFTCNLTGEYKRLNSATTLDFTSLKGRPDITDESLSGNGIYSIKSLSSEFNHAFFFKKLLFSASATAGIAEIFSKEMLGDNNYLMPVLKFRISQKSKIFKKAENRLEIRYEQAPMNLFSYRSDIYPAGIITFEQKKIQVILIRLSH